MTGASIFFVFVGIFFGISLICAILSDFNNWDQSWEKITVVLLMAAGLIFSGCMVGHYYDKEFALQMKNIEYHQESTTSVHTK